MSKRSRFDGAGYLLVDNTLSDWGTKEEADLLVCGLCQQILRKQDWTDREGRLHLGWASEGAWCHRCDKPLCHDCGGRPCPPECGGVEKWIEAQLKAAQQKEI